MFYGTELPLDGAGDPDCRKTFDWTFKNQSKDYREKFRAILGLKRETALTGTETEIAAESKMLRIRREARGERVTAYFNTSGETQAVNTEGEVLFALGLEGNRIFNNGVVVVKNKIGKKCGGKII